MRLKLVFEEIESSSCGCVAEAPTEVQLGLLVNSFYSVSEQTMVSVLLLTIRHKGLIVTVSYTYTRNATLICVLSHINPLIATLKPLSNEQQCNDWYTGR